MHNLEIWIDNERGRRVMLQEERFSFLLKIGILISRRYLWRWAAPVFDNAARECVDRLVKICVHRFGREDPMLPVIGCKGFRVD